MNISGLWDTLVEAICRPPRDHYSPAELLGGKKGECKLGGKLITREDTQLVNKKGQKLQCSHYKPASLRNKTAIPIVIYCHCNSGSRRDAEEAFYQLLPNDISVFALDFAGSGLSEGSWVTLGAHEVEDLEVSVAHLRKTHPNATIGLWGRSMGAVTALMYSATDPSIAGVVIDSAFARLTELMAELVIEQKLPIPRPLMKIALSMMRRSVRKRAGFNIDSVAPLDVVHKCFIPVLFGHAEDDTFVKLSHSQRLYEAYAGQDKKLDLFSGDHNSLRPRKFYSAVLFFFHRALLCDESSMANIVQGPSSAGRAADAAGESAEGRMRSAPSGDSSSSEAGKDDILTPRQRAMAPPWDRAKTRSFTEQQLQMMRHGLEEFNKQEKEADSDADTSPLHYRVKYGHSKPGSAQCARELQASAELSGRQRCADVCLEDDKTEVRSSDSVAEPNYPRFDNEAKGTQRSRSRLAEGNNYLNSSDELTNAFEGDSDWLESGYLNNLSEDAALAQALAISLQESSAHTQQRGRIASEHARHEMSIQEHIPDAWKNASPEDVEEYMLTEALKRSLLEAEAQEAASPARQGSAASIDSSTSAKGAASPSKQGKRNSLIFGRRKSADALSKGSKS